jgi:periplasmic protein TorT
MLALLAALLGAAQEGRADSWRPETWRLETWDPPFDYTRPSRGIEYTPLERTSRK